MHQLFKRCASAWAWALVGLLLLGGCGREDQPQEPVPTPEPRAAAPQRPATAAPAPEVPGPVAKRIEAPPVEEPAAMAPEPPAPETPEVAATPAAPAPPPVSATPPVLVRAQPYRVRPGDTLMNIARKEYGDIRYAERIYAANRDRIEDPDKIFPGQELRLPKP